MARALLLTALALGTTVAAAQAVAQPSAYAGGDRYGPGAVAAPAPYGFASAAGPAPAPAPALRGRVLGWPGKVEPRAVAAPVAVMAAPAAGPAYAWRGRAPAGYGGPGLARAGYPRPAPTAAAPTRYATSPSPAWRTVGQPAYPVAQAAAPPTLAGAPADGWRPVFADRSPAPAQAAPQAAPPTSIYAAPGPGYSPTLAAIRAAPPNRALAADRRYGYDPRQDHTVRFYSVARPFGVKPDPAPIPPQFFTATADLGGEPPGPLPINHTTATTRAAVVGGGDADGGSQ